VDPSSNFPPSGATSIENNSGAEIGFTLDATGSVNVVAGDLYIVELLLTGSEFDFSSTRGQQGVDFLDPHRSVSPIWTARRSPRLRANFSPAPRQFRSHPRWSF
jgi:hypothetical protein